MAKKYKVKKINGVRVAVKCEKDHNRPKCPPPTINHKSKKDYNRQKMKRSTYKVLLDFL